MTRAAPAYVKDALDLSALQLLCGKPISVCTINVVGADAWIAVGCENLQQIATKYTLVDILVELGHLLRILFHVGKQMLWK